MHSLNAKNSFKQSSFVRFFFEDTHWAYDLTWENEEYIHTSFEWVRGTLVGQQAHNLNHLFAARALHLLRYIKESPNTRNLTASGADLDCSGTAGPSQRHFIRRGPAHFTSCGFYSDLFDSVFWRGNNLARYYGVWDWSFLGRGIFRSPLKVVS